MKRMNALRIYLQDVRIPLITSLLLNSLFIIGSLVFCMTTAYKTLWGLTEMINMLPMLVLIIPLAYKLLKKKWKDAGIIASAFILLMCYFIWFVVIG